MTFRRGESLDRHHRGAAVREDISEKLAGLPSANRIVSLQLMAQHKAFVAKAIGQGAQVPIPRIRA
jgi:hypothetical protein